jgi:N-carbamoylputrescine amidase
MKFGLAPIKISSNKEMKNQIVDKIKIALSNECNLIAFPEYCTTGCLNYDLTALTHHAEDIQHSHFIGELKRISRIENIDISIGLLIKNANKIYNSCLYFSRGEILSRYNKISEPPPFQPGVLVHSTNTQFGKICTIICGDLYNNSVINQLRKLKPDIVLMPMDRCLGATDFCDNYHSSCDAKLCDDNPIGDSKFPCYKTSFQSYKESWNQRAKLDYCERVKLYNYQTLITNLLDHNHKIACGGALAIDGNGDIFGETQYGSDNMLILNSYR